MSIAKLTNTSVHVCPFFFFQPDVYYIIVEMIRLAQRIWVHHVYIVATWQQDYNDCAHVV